MDFIKEKRDADEWHRLLARIQYFQIVCDVSNKNVETEVGAEAEYGCRDKYAISANAIVFLGCLNVSFINLDANISASCRLHSHGEAIKEYIYINLYEIGGLDIDGEQAAEEEHDF